MRILVTGSDGFAGSYLCESLRADGHIVIPFDLRAGLDVRNYGDVRTWAEDVDAVFHLAAVAWPRECAQDPRRAMEINTLGTLNVLEAVRACGGGARVVLAGTTAEYGYDRDGTVDECSACVPPGPYEVSKLAATTLGMAYVHQFGLRVVAYRLANHTGWGRQAVNAESAFARRIVAVEKGDIDAVDHGPLTAKRDFLHVKDVVAAYRLALGLEPGIYNVTSEVPVTMALVMETLLAASSLHHVPTRQDPSLGQGGPGTFPQIRSTKLRRAGWAPTHTLTEALAEVLSYWRAR